MSTSRKSSSRRKASSRKTPTRRTTKRTKTTRRTTRRKTPTRTTRRKTTRKALSTRRKITTPKRRKTVGRRKRMGQADVNANDHKEKIKELEKMFPKEFERLKKEYKKYNASIYEKDKASMIKNALYYHINGNMSIKAALDESIWRHRIEN